MNPIISKYKSPEKAAAREQILKKLSDRYWSDAEYRNLKNEGTKRRSRELVSCVSCKKSYSRGSMLPHAKICKGFFEPTPLELLTKCMSELNI